MDHRVSDHRARLRLGVVALIGVAALAGCGRKGPLELPPSTAQTQTPTATSTPTATLAQTTAQPVSAADARATRVLPLTDDPGLIQPPGVYVKQEHSAATQNLPGPINAPSPPKPGKPFILDPLL